MSGGKPASSVAVNAGDTVVWKAITGTHGVVFDTQAAAEAILQFQSGGGLQFLGDEEVRVELACVTGVQTCARAGTTLAQATVKAGIAPGTKLGFFCSQHGRPM